MAAILDCEGWVRISSAGKTSAGNDTLVLQVGVGNTNPKLTDWLKQTFGGSVYFVNNRHETHKDYYVWRIHGNRAAEILKGILPHLLMKMQQAKLGIEFQEMMHKHGRQTKGVWGSVSLPPEYFETRRQMKKRMHQLNRKGKPLPPAETKRDDTKPALVAGSEAIVRPSVKAEEAGRNVQPQAALAVA